MNNNVFNIKEASLILHISVSMLRKLIYNNDISFFKIGNRYYFREEDICEFINNRIGGLKCI